MQVRSTVLLPLFCCCPWLPAKRSTGLISLRSRRFAGARSCLQARSGRLPNDPELLDGYAAFLERYHDPARASLSQVRRSLEKRRANRRTPRGRAPRGAARPDRRRPQGRGETDLDDLPAAGRHDLQFPAPRRPPKPTQIDSDSRTAAFLRAHGRDFARFRARGCAAGAGAQRGHQRLPGSHSNDELEQTEYLKLVHRYLSQARELESWPAPSKVIKIATCESTQTNDLLRMLGYRMRGGCGSEVVLETVNAPRAFLTTDSGFPAGRTGTGAAHRQAVHLRLPSDHGARALRAGLLAQRARKRRRAISSMPFWAIPRSAASISGCRSSIPETADELKKAIPPARLRALRHVLDFFGGNFEIRDGKAVVPGGAQSAAAWAELAGASPDKGAAFFEKLMVQGRRLAGQSLRRAGPHPRPGAGLPDRTRAHEAILCGGSRQGDHPGPARPVFRSNADMMLLTTRLQHGSRRQGRISPAASKSGRTCSSSNPQGKYDAKLSKAAADWKDPDDVLEALFALCRKPVENEPLKIFMALTRRRPGPRASR